MKKQVSILAFCLISLAVLAHNKEDGKEGQKIKSEYSITVDNTIHLPGDTIKISTNAGTGFVSIDSDSKIDRVEVVRLDGSLIQDVTANNKNVKIDLRLEPKGIYVIKCHKLNKQETFKIVLS